MHGPDHIETSRDPAAFAAWPEGVFEDMMTNEFSGAVGSLLVSETDRVRIWHFHLPPGYRCPFHRHVNPYFWSAHAAGRVRNYSSDGLVRDVGYYVGETRHFHYGPGDYMLHSVENIGESDLSFTTVEFLDGTNAALEIPQELRLARPAAADLSQVARLGGLR